MSLSKVTTPAATKQFPCYGCNRTILAGRKHVKIVLKSDVTNGRFTSARFCNTCEPLEHQARLVSR